MSGATRTEVESEKQELRRGCQSRLRVLKSAPGVTRTPDPRIRNPLLYPAELRAQNMRNMSPLGLQKSSANASCTLVETLKSYIV